MSLPVHRFSRMSTTYNCIRCIIVSMIVVYQFVFCKEADSIVIQFHTKIGPLRYEAFTHIHAHTD